MATRTSYLCIFHLAYYVNLEKACENILDRLAYEETILTRISFEAKHYFLLTIRLVGFA